MRIFLRPNATAPPSSDSAQLAPVIADRIAQWRVFMFWTRVVCWVLIAIEYMSPLNDKVQLDEMVVLGAALAALFGGRRRWPLLVTVEFFAVSYLVLEESNHYTPVALCMLVAGHAAFTTKIPFPVLYAIGLAGLGWGFTDGHFPAASFVRVSLIVGVALFGSRLFRVWLEDLASDIGRGFNDLFDRGFGQYPEVMDFATATTDTLDSMIDNDPVVDKLRDRINELETANAAAAAALSIADHDDEFEDDCEPMNFPGIHLPSLSIVRPHLLTKMAHGGRN